MGTPRHPNLQTDQKETPKPQRRTHMGSPQHRRQTHMETPKPHSRTHMGPPRPPNLPPAPQRRPTEGCERPMGLTLYPVCRWRSLGLGWKRRSMRSPLSRMMYLAPGYWLFPRRTNSCSLRGQRCHPITPHNTQWHPMAPQRGPRQDLWVPMCHPGTPNGTKGDPKVTQLLQPAGTTLSPHNTP